MTEETKPRKKSGRKTRNNDELFERRVEVTKDYAFGMSISALARKYDVYRDVIEADLKEYERWANALEKGGVDSEKISLRAVRKIAINAARKANNPAGKAGLLGKAIEASREISILKGARKVDGAVSINNMQVSDGAENAYDKLSDKQLKAEFDRRRDLLSSIGDKKGKKKL